MLTFQEIISSSPFSNAEIIGGWKGKEKFFVEVQNGVENLNKPTLLVLSVQKGLWEQLSEYLSFQHVSGIILLGGTHSFIPHECIKRLDTFQKPILFLKDRSFQTVKKAIEDFEQLKSMGLYHYVWDRSIHDWILLVNSQGIRALFNRLQLWLDQEVFLLDPDFKLYSFNECPYKTDHFKHLALKFNQQIPNDKETFFMVSDDTYNYLLFQMVSNEQHFGFILLEEKEGMMVDVCMEQVTHALPAMVSFLKENHAVNKAHKEYKDHFLHNLLYNNLESEHTLITQGKQWGWDFTQPTQLMVMRMNTKVDHITNSLDEQAIIRTTQGVISSGFFKSVVFSIQGDFVMIIFNADANSSRERKAITISLAEKIQQTIQKHNTDFECHIGLGRYYPSNMDLFRSFYEAKLALEMGKYEFRDRTVLHFENIGIGRLFSNIDHHILHDFYSEMLGELIRLDEENDDFYIETLEAYFMHNGDINQTAEKLFIHANTLRKRLKKIEAILHVNLDYYEDLFKIYASLTMMKMLK